MERAEAVPAAGAGRARAVLSCAASSTGTGTGACRASTSTRQAGPGRFRTVLSRTVLVPARLNRPVWPSIPAALPKLWKLLSASDRVPATAAALLVVLASRRCILVQCTRYLC